MGVEVDSVIVDLEARLGQYRQNMREAIGLQRQYQAGWGAPANDTAIAETATRAKQSAKDVAQVSEQTDQRITRSRKKRQADTVAADGVELASAKKTAADKAAAEEAAQARATAAVERGLAKRAAAIQRGSGRMNTSGAVVKPGDTVARMAIPASVLAGDSGAAAEVAAETEVNHLLAEQASLQSALTFANGKDRDIIRDKLAELRLIKQLQTAGLDDAAIAIQLDQRALAIEAERAAVAGKQSKANALRFAEGAGIGRSYGSVATVAGIGAAAAVGITVEAVDSAIEFAKALKTESDQLGISTHALQVYQKAASDLGVSQEQLSSGLGQLSANLGKAQDGAKQQSKVFKALGIDVGNARDGLKSVDDVLPQMIDRLSSISDPAQRAAVETALFGEAGRKLDGLLSGGTDAINNLSEAMDRAGSVLSPQDIETLSKAGAALSAVKEQLEVDLARVVAGNADAIMALANVFGYLADHIGGAIQRFTEYIKVTKGFGLFNPAGVVGALTSGFADGITDTNSRDSLTNGSGPGSKLLAGIRGDGGKVNQGLLSKAFAPDGPKGRKGRAKPTAEQIQDDIDARDQRLDAEALEAKAALTQSAEDRAAAANAQLDAERAAYAKSLADDKKLSALDRKRLLIKEDGVVAAQRQKIDQDRLNQIATEDFQLADDERAAKIDALQAQLSLATTVKARRDLEQQILAAETDRTRAQLNHQIDVGTPAEGERALAQEGRLPQIAAQQSKEIDASHMGPLADYLNKLPRDAGRLDEALQEAAVGGLQSLNDGLSTAVDKFLHLHGIAGQFLSDLVKIGIERELLIPFANELFPTASKQAGGSTGGGILGSLINAVGSFFGGGGNALSGVSDSTISAASYGLPGLAGGGTGIIGGNPGVDQNLLSLNGKPVARVGRGETLSVSPNVALSNQRVAAQAPQQTVLVVQPIHADFSGARTDEQTMRAFTSYADARSKQAYEAAVKTAGVQAAPIIQRKQTLGS